MVLWHAGDPAIAQVHEGVDFFVALILFFGWNISFLARIFFFSTTIYFDWLGLFFYGLIEFNLAMK